MQNIVIAGALTISLLVPNLQACTDFQVKAKDGSIVIGRSNEFSIDLASRICVFPRGERKKSVINKEQKGISWISKYGFVGIDALKNTSLVFDGMNEKGLAVEALNFPGAVYQPYKAGESLALTDIASWLLGNFATTTEVKRALKTVNVVEVPLPTQIPLPLGFHLAVHDAQGNNIVIEFIKGKQKVYDNPLGVMTNRPTLGWHLTNLRNYLNLTTDDVPASPLGPITIEPLGCGNGWHGLPGDWTSPSRFVRAAFFVHKAQQPENAVQAINFANHVLYTVDIPDGLVAKMVHEKRYVERTQWVVIKDLGDTVLYYRSYNDGTLKKIDLKQLNFDTEADYTPLPLEAGRVAVIDVTKQLQSSLD
jgi:choloylglycine hydrolase